MIRPAAAVLLALCLAGAAHADPFLPPPEAVDAALAAHPRVRAADARVRAAQANARALAVGPHEFELSGSLMSRDVRVEGRRYDEFDASLRRGVRLPGKAALDRKAGTLEIEVAELSRDEVRHETALDLADTLFAWLSAGAEAAVQQDAVSGHEREVAGLKRRLELKDASQLDLDQAVAALQAARAQLAEARGRALSARARLVAAYPSLSLPERPAVLPPPVLDPAAAADLAALAVTRDHEVRAAAVEVQRQDVLVRRARQDRFADPNVGVRMFSERSRDEVGVGVVASIPLGGGRRSALAAQQLAQSQAAAQELAALTAASRASAEANRISTLAAIETWVATSAAADSAREAARRRRVAYDAGGADLADLLYAERQLMDAARAEVLQRAEAARAIVRMRIDAHQLWAAVDHDAEG